MTTPLPYGLVPQDILDARELFDDEVLAEGSDRLPAAVCDDEPGQLP